MVLTSVFCIDHYGIVPSFDHFLKINPTEVKRHFFQVCVSALFLIGVAYSPLTQLMT